MLTCWQLVQRWGKSGGGVGRMKVAKPGFGTVATPLYGQMVAGF